MVLACEGRLKGKIGPEKAWSKSTGDWKLGAQEIRRQNVQKDKMSGVKVSLIQDALGTEVKYQSKGYPGYKMFWASVPWKPDCGSSASLGSGGTGVTEAQ
ncbi:hypothetical protein Nepgr_021249 [Nepenthes gracilis]|uniref:Uncharacterized protein n=1 Tax=Nepenthes gracilis TaxID=150966 RepID=A0AAD3XVY6_NEPGR|nr:hypothetical protein Nepgr_021249 [Nepenthes gracilis]